jgi:hypothetical protein
MSDLTIAEFLVSREPGRGYCVSQSAGILADGLRQNALEVLDLLGPIRSGGHGTIDAWLGPIGDDDRYVRVQVWKGNPKSLYFWQVWFSKDELPNQPADVVCSLMVPDDSLRIADGIQEIFASNESRVFRYRPDTDALEFCRAITTSWDDVDARKITWITDTESPDVPVHLRLCHDSTLIETVSASTTRPIPQSNTSRRHQRRGQRGLAFYLIAATVLLLIGYVAGTSRFSHTARQLATVKNDLGKHGTDHKPVDSSRSQPQLPTEILQLKAKIRRSSSVTGRLRELVGRPHVATSPGDTVIEPANTIRIQIQHHKGSLELKMGEPMDRVRVFSSTEARQLLDLLIAMQQFEDQ